MDCESKCLTCNKTQKFKVNFAMHHGFCKSCNAEAKNLVQCIHCESLVPILTTQSDNKKTPCSMCQKFRSKLNKFENCPHLICKKCSKDSSCSQCAQVSSNIKNKQSPILDSKTKDLSSVENSKRLKKSSLSSPKILEYDPPPSKEPLNLNNTSLQIENNPENRPEQSESIFQKLVRLFLCKCLKFSVINNK